MLLVKDREAEAGAGMAVASAGLGDVFHFPTGVSRVCEELRFPVLQTKKLIKVFTQQRAQSSFLEFC